MIFKNASVVFPDGVRKADIRTEGGIIAEIAPRIAGKDAIDLEGLTVFPGFIDMHVHLRDPGYTYKAAAASRDNNRWRVARYLVFPLCQAECAEKYRGPISILYQRDLGATYWRNRSSGTDGIALTEAISGIAGKRQDPPPRGYRPRSESKDDPRDSYNAS